MKKQPLLTIAAALILVLGMISGCSDDDDSAVASTVTVSGTITRASWTTDDFIFAVFPDGVDAGPDGQIGVGGATGSTSSPYSVSVTTVPTNAYVFAWDDDTAPFVGEPDIPGEFFGCSAVFAVGTSDISSVDIVLESGPTSCDSHLGP